MFSTLVIDVLVEHTSLITLMGQMMDLGNIFNAGCLAIRASHSIGSLSSKMP